jgi:Transposase DDE domain
MKARMPKVGGRGRRLDNADLLRRAVGWVLNDRMFADLALHGNVSWVACELVTLALAWAWSPAAQLTSAFDEAREIAVIMFGRAAVTSYQGLLGALITYTKQLRPILWKRLQELMQQFDAAHVRVGEWFPLAVDGSRVSAPRTVSNERAFAAPRYGQSRRARSRVRWKNKRRRSKQVITSARPQIWITLLWHMGLKMPWCWRLGPSTASERDHLTDMLRHEKLPENTLICGDAGFVGNSLWREILGAGHSFLIRVGGNVRLLRKLGSMRQYDNLVYFWPDQVARQKQPPLVLRLIEFPSTRGRVYLLTNVLSQRCLSDSQAAKLYRLRWGVELQFRTFKQTFGRDELRSRTAEAALAELEWSLFGLWMIALLAVKEQLSINSIPERCSMALAIGIIQRALRNWSQTSADDLSLRRLLRRAVKDSYRRHTSKKSRHRRNFKDQPTTQPPEIVIATSSQRHAYRQLQRRAA